MARSILDDLLDDNAAMVTARQERDPKPTRGLAVVTCMDARIDLSRLGIQTGQAHVIRNAGGRVTDDVIRSLAISSHLLGVTTVVVMEHTGCGLAGVSNQVLRERIGAEIDFLPIADHQASVEADLRAICETPYLDRLTTLAGLLYDVETGAATELTRIER